MSQFAVQHSLMARNQFKQWWTQYVPKFVERSTYVLFASLTLILLFWQWRPTPAIVWEISNPEFAATILTLSFGGWVIVFTSTFLINHFERSDCTRLPTISLAARCLRRVSGRRCITRLCGTDDDGRTSAVRGGDHCLHLPRHPFGRTGSGGHVRGRLPPPQEAGIDAGTLA